MHTKSHQVFLRTPNSHLLRTLTFDPSQTLTLRDLKLSLVSDHGNPNSFYFTLDGKLLHDGMALFPHIPSLSTLVLRHRLLGGGGDGGATGAESRDCYLKMYAEKKPDKVDPNEQRLSKWVNCALSYETLRQPCVIDRLGNVFNKEALVEALIGKKLPKAFGHIKGLKDMIDIKLEPVLGGVETNNAWFQCPITGLEFNGTYKFLALRKCGHVLSAKALKEVKSSACLVCYMEFEECDKIVINGSEEEVEVLRARMEEERAKVRDKKQKKVKNGDVVVGNGVNNGKDGVEVEVKEKEKSTKLIGNKHGIIDAKDVQKANAKGEKMNGKIESNKRFKAVDIAPAHATKEVYASLFTSSQKKKDFRETYSCRSLGLGRN